MSEETIIVPPPIVKEEIKTEPPSPLEPSQQASEVQTTANMDIDSSNTPKAAQKTFKRPNPKDPRIRIKKKPRSLKVRNHNFLCVWNFPPTWGTVQIKDYFKRECRTMISLELLFTTEDSEKYALMEFRDDRYCLMAWKIFRSKEVEGTHLAALRGPEDALREHYDLAMKVASVGAMSGNDSEASEVCDVKQNATQEDKSTILDIWSADPTGIYGLSQEFLKQNKIKTPLTQWVHVTNFCCDKATLKEVLDLAGNVLVLHIMRTKVPYAKVKYSHPIEAAQAVSLLHNQYFLGKCLTVCIDPGPHKEVYLPQGLNRIGQGFGTRGRPLKDIVHQYKRHLKGKTNEVNAQIFDTTTNDGHTDAVTESVYEDKLVQTDVGENDRIMKIVDDLKTKGVKIEEMLAALKGLLDKDEIMDINDGLKTQVSSPRAFSPSNPGFRMRSASLNQAQLRSSSLSPASLNSSANSFQNNTNASQASGSSNQGNFPFKGPFCPGKMGQPFGPSVPHKQGPQSHYGPINSVAFQGQGSAMGSMQGVPQGSMMGPQQVVPQGSVMGTMQGGPQGSMLGPQQGVPQGNMMGPQQRVPQGNMLGPMQGVPQGNMLGPMQVGPQGSMMGPMQGPIAGSHGPMMGPMQGQQGQFGPNQMGPPINATCPKASDSSTLVLLNNLPPGVSYPVLKDKMLECGEVDQISMCKPGCATVRFRRHWEARRCVGILLE